MRWHWHEHEGDCGEHCDQECRSAIELGRRMRYLVEQNGVLQAGQRTLSEQLEAIALGVLLLTDRTGGPPQPVPVTVSLTVEGEPVSDITIPIGDQQTVGYTEADANGNQVTPADGTSVAWSGDNDGVATVFDNGDGTAVIHSVAVGSANVVVTVTLPDGTTLTGSAAVTVAAGAPVTVDVVAIGEPTPNV
jgi:hypothetical protein